MSATKRIGIAIAIGVIVVSGTVIVLMRNGGSSVPVADQPSATDLQTARATLTGSQYSTPDSYIAPKNEQWPSEAFTDKATVVLKKFKKATSEEELATLASHHFANEFTLYLAPQEPEQIHAADLLSTTRVETAGNTDNMERLQGADASAEFLRRLGVGSRKLRLLKIVAVTLGEESVTTKVRCESVKNGTGKRTQEIQTWQCEWRTHQGEAPQLLAATLLVQQSAKKKGDATFVDRTLDIVGETDAFQSQLKYGLQHWLARIETAHGMNYFSKHGLSVADVNGDGLDDLFVCQPAGIPNRLFLQRENGSAVDSSTEYGLDLLDRTSSALFVDLDNDGDQDLVLATITGLKVYENNGRSRFVLRAEKELRDTDLQGISAADYDNDGDLDLYQIVDYASDESRTREGLPSFVYHNANDGGSNVLLRNDIDGTNWQFQDVTEQVGLEVNNRRHSLAAAWDDYDDDGDPDLYVANDYGQNCLYRNDGGTFSDVASIAGVTDFGSGMSVAWGDYDRDQHLDLYVSNMFSSAGNRITTQTEFLPKLSGDRKRLYTRFAKGNSLFRNLGDGTFSETGRQLDVEIARWAWGSLFADFNNDGWEDLLVANGYITTPDTGDL